MRRVQVTVIFLCLFDLATGSYTLGADGKQSADSIYSQAIRSVAMIQELQSICTPGLQMPKQNTRTLGTGFYVQRDEGGQRSTWLVTARHVVEKHADLFAKTRLDSNSKEEVYLVLPRDKWTFHPGPNPNDRFAIDVAVMKVLVPMKAVAFLYCVNECSIDPNSKQRLANHLEGEPEPTDRALFFGYPVDDIAPEEIPPFVRSGIVAYSTPNPRLLIDGRQFSDDRIFLVDALAFPGNSGGPVMMEPSLLSGGIRLWGLVTGSNTMGHDYTIVTPVTRIKETIEHAFKQTPTVQDSWSRTRPVLSHNCGGK